MQGVSELARELGVIQWLGIDKYNFDISVAANETRYAKRVINSFTLYTLCYMTRLTRFQRHVTAHRSQQLA